MPQVLVPVISAIGSAVGGAVGASMIMYAGAYATGITLLGTLALSSAQQRKAERKQRAQYDSSVADRMVNVQNAIAPRELVLGRTRKGGAAFFQTSITPHNAVFVSVLALAGHEIDGVEQIYFNETPVSLDANGNVTTAPWGRTTTESASETTVYPVTNLAHTPIANTLTVTARRQVSNAEGGEYEMKSVDFSLSGSVLTINSIDPAYTYYVNYQWVLFLSAARVFIHLGSPDQEADARMQQLMPGVWTANHRARGVAYIECEFVYYESAFPTGLPNVTAQIRGAKCYDARSGATVFTENPALHMRHVLMHPQFGKRTSLTLAEELRIIAAANSCDLPISYTGADYVPMYRSALVTPFGAPARDVLDDLSQAMGGEWAFAAGEFYCRAGVYQAPVMNLTDADLAVVQRSGDGGVSQSPIGISPHRPRAEKINTVAARIWDQAANYLETPLTPFRSEALVTADGVELSQEITMPAVFYGGQAFHICGIMLRDGRDPLTVTLPFKMRAYPLELFDGVTLTLSRYGWVNKEFRILSRTFMPGGYVMLTLKETTAAIFQHGAAFLPEGLAPNTGLPKPWEIYPPVLAEISSGEGELIVQTDGTIVNSIRVTWAPILEASVASSGTVEVQFLVLPDGDWRSVVAQGDATEARLTGVADLAFVIIRARTRSTLASSDWSPQVLHQVVGKTEPPPNIENLSISGSVLSWSLPRRVPDLAGFIFRFHYGSNLDWGSAAPLHTGLITESPYDLVARPGGVVTIMGKAIDTTGNLSLATGNIVMDLGDSPIANIVEQWDFRALGWPTSPDGGLLAAGRYAQYTIANIFSSERATTATYVAGGVFQTAAVDEPRFENGQLLIEGEATNLLRNSQNLAGAGWTGACAVNVAAESYRGVAFAEIAKTTIAGSEQRGQSFGAVTAGQTCTATLALLAGVKPSAMIGLYSVAETWGAVGSGSAEILEGPGAVSPYAGGSAFNFTGLSATVPTLIRITRTYVSASTGVLYIYPGSASAGPIGDSVKVAYTQVEVGAAPTSYIPTTATPVTRAADNVYVSESQYGYTKSGGDLAANALDSLYGTDDQSFFGADLDPFYEAGSYGQMVYVTNEVPVSKALAGSIMTLATVMQGVDLHIDYRLSGPGSLYGTGNDPFYGPDTAPFYDGPGAWMPWPGQLIVQNEVYQFRVTIGAGVDRGILEQMVLTVDAPDIEETLADVAVNAAGTAIPYTKAFTSIKTVQATLQANASGAVTVEITKTNPLAPVIRAFNAAHAAVSGATADITVKGY